MIKRIRCHINGIVQGVGMRPFVYRLANELGLTGHILNQSDGVSIEIQGPRNAADDFLKRLQTDLPQQAHIAQLTSKDLPPESATAFHILESSSTDNKTVYLPPDIATCSACRRDLFNPTDRRYRYPFINCTGCGPRLTIINDIPYDRRTTSMACFPLCPACQREYDNPADRRFHAEPNACPDCGPSLALYEHDGTHRHTDDPLTDVIKLLKQDRIIAIKGIGGFHLCIDASSTQAVTRLRNKKYREEKPLAVMVRDINNARKIAHISSQEQLLLESPQRPIVLVKKHEEASISPAVAPGMNRLGIMLAYSPMHLLLLENNFTALVMTSANKTDEPICIGNREALNRLSGIADAFLTHNRDILVRCDDSIAFVTGDAARITRRSRGYAPVPHQLDSSYPDILALGPQLKSTVCVLTHNRAYLSPHIGDLETPEARDFFIESIDVTQKIARCNPDIIVTDMHPGYFSTRHAAELKPRKLLQVQHHHAHIVSCMAENDLSGQVIGLAMDGTGYGTDGTIWGGEFLVADPATFSRSGHLQTFSLPGGDKAIREPWRIGAGLLRDCYGEGWQDYARKLALCNDQTQYELLDQVMHKNLNCPRTTSLGRLFDAVSALCGIRRMTSYEGQAAIELEAAATFDTDLVLPYDIIENNDVFIFDFHTMLQRLVEDLSAQKETELLPRAFHNTICHALTAMAEKIKTKTALNRIALSGGCFQNRLLLEGCINMLQQKGFEVYAHQNVPTNDGGVSLGQAVIAGTRIKQGLE